MHKMVNEWACDDYYLCCFRPGGPDLRFKISNFIHEIVNEWACDNYYLCCFRPGGPDLRFKISNSIHEIVNEWACDNYYLCCCFRPEARSQHLSHAQASPHSGAPGNIQLRWHAIHGLRIVSNNLTTCKTIWSK